MHNDNCQDCQEERQKFYDSFESDKPYINIVDGTFIKVREFPADVEPHLLKWHEDEQTRFIISAKETDWKFQFDNELPIPIPHDRLIKIEKGRIHRVIKGTGSLRIHIAISPDDQN
jgi:hypothetical protein